MLNVVHTLPASRRREFGNGALASFISGLTAHVGADEGFKPSCVRMNKASALTALGGKASPQSFVTGLLFSVSAFAYGQGKVDSLTKGCPCWAAFAVSESCKLLKMGAGATKQQVVDAVSIGISKMLVPNLTSFLQPLALTASRF